MFFTISIYNELLIGAISGGSMPRFLIFCWVLIYAKTLISPEILFGLPRLNKHELLSDSEMIIRENWFVDFTPEISVRDEKLAIILKEHIFSYAKNIDQVCYNKQLFRDKTFKINNLSQLLKVPESHLIYLFKYHSSLSFSEYRTQCRINDAITLISKNYLEKKHFRISCNRS